MCFFVKICIYVPRGVALNAALIALRLGKALSQQIKDYCHSISGYLKYVTLYTSSTGILKICEASATESFCLSISKNSRRAYFTYLLGHGVAGDIGNGIGYREDLVGLGVGDLNAKLLLQSHHHLDGVKGVQVKIILELGSGGDLGVGHLNQFEEGKSFGQSDKPPTNT